MRGVDDRADILVGARRLLGDAARGRAAHDDAARRQIVDDLRARASACSAWWRLIARPAPWQAEAKARSARVAACRP